MKITDFDENLVRVSPVPGHLCRSLLGLRRRGRRRALLGLHYAAARLGLLPAGPWPTAGGQRGRGGARLDLDEHGERAGHLLTLYEVYNTRFDTIYRGLKNRWAITLEWETRSW